MKEHTCQIVSRETLVAYSDGELSPNETERIAGHIAVCLDCQTVIETLERSLQVTKAIWQTGEAQWPRTGSFDRITSKIWLFKKEATVAAGILILLGIGLTWQLLTERGEPTGVNGKEPTATEIEIKANQAAVAAQMLAVADLLASQPGGEKYAIKRYNYVINSFNGGQESEQARLRLKMLIERRVER